MQNFQTKRQFNAEQKMHNDLQKEQAANANSLVVGQVYTYNDSPMSYQVEFLVKDQHNPKLVWVKVLTAIGEDNSFLVKKVGQEFRMNPSNLS